MKIKTIIKVIEIGYAVTCIIPIVKTAKDRIHNSEKIKQIKKDFELRRAGVMTVKYDEV